MPEFSSFWQWLGWFVLLMAVTESLSYAWRNRTGCFWRRDDAPF